MPETAQVIPFQSDNDWQDAQRERLLVPGYQIMVDAGLMRSHRKTTRVEQPRGDTFFELSSGITVGLEEKIVRWKGRTYTAITLETHSCTVPGYERAGWMRTGRYEFFLYARCCEDDSADVDIMHFPRLQTWFWRNETSFAHTTTMQQNMTRCRVVPLDALRASVPVIQLRLPADKDQWLRLGRVMCRPQRGLFDV
jgi:hypothetical protein